MKTQFTIACLCVALLMSACSCNKKGNTTTSPTHPDTTTTPVISQVAFWLTNPDKSVLLEKQNLALNFSSGPAVQPVITVDTTTTYQQMDGFGYCMTGGSAQLIYGLPPGQRQAIEAGVVHDRQHLYRRELFAADDGGLRYECAGILV